MMKVFPKYSFFCTLAMGVFFGTAGCVSSGAPREAPEAAPSAVPAAPVIPDPATPAAALADALHRQLDLRIQESLEGYAAEHAENRRTLSAALALRREEGEGVSLTDSRRREALEHAVGFAHLLGTGEKDLFNARRPRERQLLARQTAAALIRWQLRDLLPLRERRECELELKLLTGWETARLERLSGSGVAAPCTFPNDLESLQQFAVYNRPECGHLRIHHELAASLRLAGESLCKTEERLIDLLYRLPLAPAGRDVDPVKLVQTAIGAAVALQIDGDLKKLNRAYDLCRMAELRNELEPTPRRLEEKRRAAAAWQLAFVDLMTDLGNTDYGTQLPRLKPFDAPELTPEVARVMEKLKSEVQP